MKRERERERKGLANKATLGYHHQTRIESEYSADWSGVQAISYNYRQRWTGIVPRRTVNRTMGREIEASHATMSTIIFESLEQCFTDRCCFNRGARVTIATQSLRLCFDHSTVKLLRDKITEVFGR